MSADDVMIWQAIRPWKGGKPYAEHNHHFYPIWLGGLDHGPTIKVRGFEHISILEPQLERFMYKKLSRYGVTNQTMTRKMIKSNEIPREEIFRHLTDFLPRILPWFIQRCD